MKNLKSFFRNNLFVILAFILTGLMCCTIYALRHIAPFGSESILRVDLFHQYAPFLEELRSRILNGQSLSYSWEDGLGKDFLTQMAYYTASPLDFLVLLFPESLISEFIAFLIALKTCFCGGTFAFFLKKHFGKNDLSVTMFGLFYAFCGFMTCYYWNVMWLDTVALFPLVALGVEALVKENRHLFYYIVLTLTMIVNFYLAVLVCVFTALYYLLTVFSVFSLRNNLKIILQRTIKFGLVSIICALSAMFILLPVVIALGQTTTSQTAFPAFDLYDNIYQLIACHFIGARPSVLARNEDLPNVFSGVLTLVLLPAYFCNKKIPLKEKIMHELLIFFILLCCVIQPLDFLIHGLHFPSNLPHRFTFIYSFLLLSMAYEAWIKLKDCHFIWMILCAVFYAAAILISEYVVVPKIWGITATLDNRDIVINFVAIGLYLVLLFFFRLERFVPRRLLIALFFTCTVAECLFSGYDGMNDTGDRNDYVAYLDDTSDALAAIDAQEEDAFYRTEFRRLSVINEGSIYHYNGFSQFSSLAPGGISAFIRDIGIASTGNSYRYYDPTPLVNAIFDMKYLLNTDNPLSYDHYTAIGQFGNVYAYRNDRTLSLGFLVDSDIENWNVDSGNPFLVQNDFIRQAAGIDKDMFTLLTADSITTENMTITSGTSNDFTYSLVDSTNLSVIPRVTATYISDKDQYLYLYVEAGNASRFIYHTSRENQDREIACGDSMIDVGWVYAGEVITVEFELTKRGEFELQYRSPGTVRLYAASYNDDVFQEAYDKLSQGCMDITSFADTHIEGTVHAEEDEILFTSIPYVDGWTVSVDGETVDKISIGNDGVIGVPVSAGDHTITLDYNLKGFRYAVIITIFGVFLIILFTFLDRKICLLPNPEGSASGRPQLSKKHPAASAVRSTDGSGRQKKSRRNYTSGRK